MPPPPRTATALQQAEFCNVVPGLRLTPQAKQALVACMRHH
jgi:hypothetical protein